MKRANKSLVNLILLALVALVLVTAARAQVFVGGIGVTNTGTVGGTLTNAPVLNLGVIQTNQASTTLNPRFVQINNISTNETVTLQFGWVIPQQGASNFYVSSTLVTNFPASNGWAQGGTFQVSIPGQTPTISLVPYGMLTVSNGSNTVLWY